MTTQGRHPNGRATILGLCLAVASAVGCNGNKNSLLPQIEDVVIFQHEAKFSDLARLGIYSTDFEVPGAGSLSVVVDWTSATDDLDVYLTNPSCDTATLTAGLCKFFGKDESNAKPAKVVLATGVTAYRVLVVNRGPGPESGTVEATVTEGQLAQ
jgi:hypothetical protein